MISDWLLSFYCVLLLVYVCDIFYDIILCVCFFNVCIYIVLLFVQSTVLDGK